MRKPANLAELIEQTRLARNVTPSEAARQIGVPSTRLSRWRRGGGISMEHLSKVAEWVGVPLGELQPLAGFPAPAAALPCDDTDGDSRLSAVRAYWPALDEGRRTIIHEIATRGGALVPPAARTGPRAAMMA